jgi:hypothetical protein
MLPDVKIVEHGSLEVVESFSGFHLYGKDMDGETIHLACLGDGVDQEHLSSDDYDPNDDYQALGEAYWFETV